MDGEAPELFELDYSETAYLQVSEVVCSITQRHLRTRFTRGPQPYHQRSHTFSAFGEHVAYAQIQEDVTAPSELEQLTGVRFTLSP